jgi:hypothetical protein
MRKLLFLLFMFLAKCASFAQTQTIPYHKKATMTAGSGLQTTLTNFTTCQSAVTVNFSAKGYSGTWTQGNFEYYVNDVLIGSGVGNQTFNISSYIPVNSVKVKKTDYSNWNEVEILVNVTSSSSSAPAASPIVSNVNYCKNQTATALTATLSSTGTHLKWYTSDIGGNFSTNPPTPSTTTVGTSSYWVAQATTAGCESTRAKIDVMVSELPTAPVATSQSVCAGSTINNLSATGTNLKWYSSATGGSPLATTTAVNSGNYFVSQSNTSCESARTQVAVTLTTSPTPTGESSQSFSTSNPTLSNIVVSPATVVWYATEENAISGNNPLASTTVIENNTTYYAVNVTNGCRSLPFAVTVLNVGLNSENFETNKVTFYPNPTSDVLHIQNDTTIVGIEVSNAIGQIMLQQTTNNANVQLNVSHLSSGTYFVKLLTTEKTKSFKMVKF